jgi:hypothetical protein
VPHPPRDDVDRELLQQFRLPARPQVVQKWRPRLQAGTLDKFLERSPAPSTLPRHQGGRVCAFPTTHKATPCVCVMCGVCEEALLRAELLTVR